MIVIQHFLLVPCIVLSEVKNKGKMGEKSAKLNNKIVMFFKKKKFFFVKIKVMCMEDGGFAHVHSLEGTLL